MCNKAIRQFVKMSNKVNQNFMQGILRSTVYLLVLTGLGFVSCNKFEGDQTVPAYLRVDTVKLETDYFTQGSNTHNITDVWVYVNDQLIGAFELPAVIPVLARGEQKLEIRPGIKLNGIGSTRTPYPFYQPYLINDFNFVEDSVIKVNPMTSYYSTAKFAWIEDFENASISLEKTSQSDTAIYKTSPINSPEAWLSEHSSYSGEINLDEQRKQFKIASFNAFILPGSGSPVLLELDYKCTHSFGVGLFAEMDGTIVDLPLVVVNKSEKWNKIYINIGPNISAYSNASNFKVYFESSISEGSARFYLDNVKLIYRNNS